MDSIPLSKRSLLMGLHFIMKDIPSFCLCRYLEYLFILSSSPAFTFRLSQQMTLQASSACILGHALETLSWQSTIIRLSEWEISSSLLDSRGNSVLKKEWAHSIESSVIEILLLKVKFSSSWYSRITFSKQMFFCQSNFLLVYGFTFRIQSFA